MTRLLQSNDWKPITETEPRLRLHMSRHADGSYVLLTGSLKTRKQRCAPRRGRYGRQWAPEAFEAFLVSLATENERWFPENDPDNPILEILDEHRSKAKLGFRSLTNPTDNLQRNSS